MKTAHQLLSDLVDHQNGPPLERHRNQYEQTMQEIDQYFGRKEVTKTNLEKAQQLYNDWRERNGKNPERVEFAAYCLDQEINRLDSLTLEEKWSEANTTIIVNFLIMPIEHQKSLMESIKERKPELFA